MKKMRQGIKKQWVDALRSGVYQQGRGLLRDERDNFCCLGVLCNLHAQAHPEIAAQQKDSNLYMGYQTFPPSVVREWAGLTTEAQGELADMNDRGSDFQSIADHIEETL